MHKGGALIYSLINVMEILVKETVDEVLKANPHFCSCQRCRLDLAALALNKLSPSYVVTQEGEVWLRANALRQQCKVDLIRVVAESINTVAEHPHHQGTS